MSYPLKKANHQNPHNKTKKTTTKNPTNKPKSVTDNELKTFQIKQVQVQTRTHIHIWILFSLHFSYVKLSWDNDSINEYLFQEKTQSAKAKFLSTSTAKFVSYIQTIYSILEVWTAGEKETFVMRLSFLYMS